MHNKGAMSWPTTDKHFILIDTEIQGLFRYPHEKLNILLSIQNYLKLEYLKCTVPTIAKMSAIDRMYVRKLPRIYNAS